MYQVFLGYMPLPIAPSKMETSIKGRNSTIELINGQEVNILKKAGLTEISFEFMIPHQTYPFSTIGMLKSMMDNTVLKSLFPSGIVGSLLDGAGNAALATTYLYYLEKLKQDRKPFQFIVARIGQNALSVTNTYNTNLTVTLEDYSIIEDAENGMDTVISVSLKQYVPYYTKIHNSNKMPAKKVAVQKSVWV